MVRSRLSNRTVAKTKKNLILSILGIIVLFVIAFQFGLPLLVKLSLFISGSNSNQEQLQISNNPSFIAPPTLDFFPEATSSANIKISGISDKDQKISLYINNELINKVDTDDDGTFVFEEKISKGESVIKVKAIVDGKESEFSNSITTNLKSDPPSLDIESPDNGQKFEKDQKYADIKGATDSDAKVTVNELWARMDFEGNFSYRLTLKEGENKIKIIAEDEAHNKTEKEITVTYSP